MKDVLPDFLSDHRIQFPFCKNEITAEVNTFLNLLMIGEYPNSFDSMRRILEIIVATSLCLNDKEISKAKDWSCSELDTPNIGAILSSIFSRSPFNFLNKKFCLKKYLHGGSDELPTFYKSLCNYVHCKGELYSSQYTNSYVSFFELKFPQFDEGNCTNVINHFVELAFWCAILVAGFGYYPEPEEDLTRDLKTQRIDCMKILLDILPDDLNNFFIQFGWADDSSLTDDFLQIQSNRIKETDVLYQELLLRVLHPKDSLSYFSNVTTNT